MSIARLMQMSAAGAKKEVEVAVTLNDPVSIGTPFARSNGSFVTYAEFQDNGATVLQQNLWGEWKYDLSTAYDLSTISYKTDSARYWEIGQYTEGAISAYHSAYSGRVFKVDYDNDKAYSYGGDGTTKVLENLDTYTVISLTTVSSSLNPFSATPNLYGNGGTCYVKKAGGGIAYMQANHSNDIIFMRNYANATTSTVSSYSELDISSLDINSIWLAFLSTNGLTLSIWTRQASNTSVYDIHKWTLSTAFDLSTAGSITTISGSNNSVYMLENGFIINDSAISGKVIGWNMYGELRSFTYTTDGDINTLSQNSKILRHDNGAYLNGSSYAVWFDDGKKVIDMGYSTTHYVYDSTSDPYGWKFHDINFGNRISGYTSIYTSNSNEGQTFSDGRLNSAKDKLYSSYYSSNLRVTERDITTPGDISTLSGGYSGHNSAATFIGWTGSYSGNSSWYDKDNNKFHLADWSNSLGTYFIFDLDSNGEYTLAGGTYDTTPTGFNAGDLYRKYWIQPLSADGTYFVYFYSGICYIIELDVPFNPAQGYTEIGSFSIEYNLPNGVTRAYNKSQLRMYVSSGKIHFTAYYGSNITAIIDVTIDGQVPDTIT